jgi:hypothetical protein
MPSNLVDTTEHFLTTRVLHWQLFPKLSGNGCILGGFRENYHFTKGIVMLRKMMRALISVLCLSSATISITVVHAADITKVAGKSGDVDLIFIEGEILKGDDKVFKNIAFSTERAIVVLDSPGGLVMPALEIGKSIRLKSYATAVTDTSCTSACAIVWLAGETRFLSKKSKVGFHAVYVEDADGKKLPAGVGNALVGSYLNSLGLSEKIVTFVTAAGPDSMRWLNKSSADSLGLSVNILDNKKQARANFNLAIKNRWGPKPSLKEVVRLYRLAADEGFAGAQNNLGDMYEEGSGVPANDKFAVYWYARAAERGEPTAYLSLSTLLPINTNDENVLIEALKFSILAVTTLPEGKNKLNANDNMLKIGSLLSESAKDRAIELALDWEPLYQEKYLMSDTPQ